jgi:hypothetical protein
MPWQSVPFVKGAPPSTSAAAAKDALARVVEASSLL